MPNSPTDPRAGSPSGTAVPLLVEGPVEVELEDGTTVSSDRFRVALCTCRRSRRYPWCDTSHRDRARRPDE
ncbi:CDGSH iron-sulfur domain-containing protein [Streptomyces cinereospinus]